MLEENIENEEPVFFSNKDMDRTSISGNFMAPVFDQIGKRYKISEVLDIGCGNGFFSSYLLKHSNCRITGIDGSRYGLELARKAGFHETVHVSDFDRDELPVLDRQFDLIICKDLLEHLLYPQKIVKYSYERLKPGGRLLVLVPNHFPVNSRVKFLFTGDIDTQNYFPDAKEWNFPHLRFFSPHGLLEMLGQCGFVEFTSFTGYFPSISKIARLPFGKRFLNYLSTHYPSLFSNALVYLCRKPCC
ncbi:MAG: class I SAM-dependent methyltransferase [Oligoflexales bacterium]|nr:class I SAM-dependent methyltransferase [Oligoflexales bacterium]